MPPAGALSLADKWILTRLASTVERTSGAFDRFEFGVAAETLQDFAWSEFCDWYLEATKVPAAAATRGAVLSFALNVLVRLIHPIAPFISEEIWQALPHDGATIVTASWPDPAEIPSTTPPRRATTACARSSAARAKCGSNSALRRSSA